MSTFVFPDQGVQKKGMGEELFEQYKEFTLISNSILGYSIKKLCLENPDDRLNQTQYTQPALYVVNSLSYLKRIKCGCEPDFVIGHSLGEYSALFAAGVFDFETGLRLVKKRGELMSKSSGGGMAAVFGLSKGKIEKLLRENDLESIDIAGYTTPSQIVISGPRVAIVRAKSIFKEAGARAYILLKVSGAFHSRYMKNAKNKFFNYINHLEAEGFKFYCPKIPVISNLEARPYTKSKIKQLLADQIDHPVKWSESIRYLMKQDDMEFEKIGPGKVAMGLIKKIQKELRLL